MKLEQQVIFPLRLDVTPFCYTGGHHTDSIGVPTALQANATLASSLPQLSSGRISRPTAVAGLPTEASSSPAHCHSPMAKALHSPQPQRGAKQALVGGSVDGSSSASASEGVRKVLNGLPNSTAGMRAGGRSSGNIRGHDFAFGRVPGKQGVDYDLKAVIVHQGGANTGHYTAFRKLESGEEDSRSEATEMAHQPAPRGRGAQGEGDWVDISDETVRRVSVRHVLASQAYMLFYRRRIAQAYCQDVG